MASDTFTSQPFVQTADDVMAALGSFVTGRPVGPSVSQYTMRRSAEAALREIVNVRDWVTMIRQWRIQLYAAQIGGYAGDNTSGSTISYTASQGQYPYQVTLTGATWPTWAPGAELRVGDGFTNCDIDQVYSPTVATLKWPRVPTCDFNNWQYMIGRSWYALPPEMTAFWACLGHNAWFIQGFIPFDEWHALDKYRAITGMPRKVSIGPAPSQMGQLALYIFPWSINNEEMDMVLKVRPRPIKYWGRDAFCYAGTVYGAAGSQVVTGIGTNFYPGMVGASIRFSWNQTKPTGTAGDVLGNNPYAEQHTIIDVYSQTSLLIDVPLTYSYGSGGTTPVGQAYCIADWIDLDVSIFDAYIANCQRQLAHLAGFKPEEIREIEGFYQTTLSRARIADDRTRQRMVAGNQNNVYSRLRDWPNRPTVGGSVSLAILVGMFLQLGGMI
jgi:hypothetical protein